MHVWQVRSVVLPTNAFIVVTRDFENEQIIDWILEQKWRISFKREDAESDDYDVMLLIDDTPGCGTWVFIADPAKAALFKLTWCS